MSDTTERLLERANRALLDCTCSIGPGVDQCFVDALLATWNEAIEAALGVTWKPYESMSVNLGEARLRYAHDLSERIHRGIRALKVEQP